MGKLKNPSTISSYYKIDACDLKKLGIVNVVLNADSQLFIDPILLPFSKHNEIHENAAENYIRRFELVIKLLAASQEKGDLL